ncbi:hypothetical protein GCM10011490_25390 [Pseudoclavibacter endophyticus]|uniref:Histidine phosphatase family protein n=1 Tax=Pseudoclavibacter endophyticus TaxID=1778590 RepID=A0A6H9WJP1_9MICO|nr:histidine phosphatase family protein [Pseudoclavibacter endophyticus]KAB1647869.1 histidine phosphatase family protein [Pseudoclavibacter endophyticus]GGA73456.1 hypothetical protein GCM10011490_25390 [Pseudoclavibacter endophyticus]
MRIGLIRHGETEWNARGLLQGTTDIPLNARGRDQAEDAASLLRDGGWQRIYSSPLLRARDTAKIISSLTGIASAGVHPGFIERSFGALEGQPYATPQGTRRPLDHPSVETTAQVQARALAALEVIEDAHPDDSTLVISHGSVIRLLLDLFLAFKAPSINNLALTVIERSDTASGGLAMSSRVVTIANGYPLPLAATHRDPVPETAVLARP